MVIDRPLVTIIDATSLYTVVDMAATLRERGVVLVAAGPQTEWRVWAESRNRGAEQRKITIYPTLEEAGEYRAKYARAEVAGADVH